MSSSDCIWAIVPAAGVGSRMGAEVPKQYLRIGAQTILEITLNKLLNLPEVAGVVVALSPDDRWFTELNLTDARLIAVEGGVDRAQSVFNGLEYLRHKSIPWALVHDAARPCVQVQNIRTLVQSVLRNNTGGILAAPVADTLKAINNSLISHTVDRSAIWQAQTPQMFRSELLHAALREAFARGLTITDEASAMEQAGEPVQIVEDARDNIKITRPEDLPLAGFILNQQLEANKE